MKIAALLQSWLVMVRMESYPSDMGRSVIRSNAMVPKGMCICFRGMGTRGTFALVVPLFVLWHTAHP
jgi:hypothetical protein